jgi:signal transduction histidine kinase
LIEIAVADNGMGMSEDELEVIRRFVPGGTSKKRDGSGYGLPIARRRVRDHRGDLRIESRLNEGTTVTITLPVEAESDDPT